MTKIEIPDTLRAEIVHAQATLQPNCQLKEAAQVADKALKYYSTAIASKFADLTTDFFRSRALALEAGQNSDACQIIIGFRGHVSGLQLAPTTPENIARLNHYFDCITSGRVHLRTDLPVIPQ
jgi:hypothetical protein